MIPKIYSVVTLVALICICSCSKSEVPQTQEDALHGGMCNATYIRLLDSN